MIGLLTVVTVLLVASTLRRPDPPTYSPTPPEPAPAGDTLVGPTVYTVDATDSDRWVFFDFSRGSVVPDPDVTGWDLAFRRHRIIANGGEGFIGRGGLTDLGSVPFDSVRSAPEDGYQLTRADSVNGATDGWYDYSMMSHLLMPKPHTWAVRTADGRYAKLELLGYYCPGAVAGCVTFRYSYQGSGTRMLGPDGAL